MKKVRVIVEIVLGFGLGLACAVGLSVACHTAPKPAAPALDTQAAADLTAAKKNPLYNVTFNHCYDGDTCNITIPELPEVFGKKLGLRIWGIDTPEIRGRCAREKELAIEAREFTSKAIADADNVEFSKVGRGKYFRLVARLKLDGRYLDDLLVQAGLAVRYYGGTKTNDWCN